MIKKIRKQISILRRLRNQSKELKRIQSINDPVLNAFAKTFDQVKKSTYSEEDRTCFKRQEIYSDQLLKSTQKISYEIFGNPNPKEVREIYKRAASPIKWCRFLFCLCKNMKAQKVFEIGANLGVSGGYILEAIKDCENPKFITMEGVSDLCDIANNHFGTLAPQENFEIIPGLYQDSYPTVLQKEITFDVLFIDGNHQKEPTLHYFNTLKSKLSQHAIMIFDDINWTSGMKECWNTIKNDPSVAYSIDMYKQGIIIIGDSKNAKAEHFDLHLAY